MQVFEQFGRRAFGRIKPDVWTHNRWRLIHQILGVVSSEPGASAGSGGPSNGRRLNFERDEYGKT